MWQKKKKKKVGAGLCYCLHAVRPHENLRLYLLPEFWLLTGGYSIRQFYNCGCCTEILKRFFFFPWTFDLRDRKLPVLRIKAAMQFRFQLQEMENSW